MNFFLVKSPLQAINALEARHTFGIDRRTAVVVALPGASPSTARQIQTVLAAASWHRSIAVPRLGLPAGWTLPIQKQFVMQTLRSFRSVERVFIGEYRSDLMRHVVHEARAETVIVLDDGAAALQTPALRHQVQSSASESLPRSVRLKHLLLDLRPQHPRAVTYFSAYELDARGDDQLIANRYSFLRARAQAPTRTAGVWFLGGPYVEVGILSSEVYLKLVCAVLDQYDERPLTYFAHRRESVANLKQLTAAFPELRIESPPSPVEWHWTRTTTRPTVVAAFASSALVNIDLAFGDGVRVHSYVVPSDLILDPARRNGFEATYRYFEEKHADGIDVRELSQSGWTSAHDDQLGLDGHAMG